MLDKLKNYIMLMRLNKPIGFFLLLWPTLWALWLASSGMPPLNILIIFITGTLVMRSAGCIINDFADRHFDKYVERTRERPLTTGAVTVKEALILFFILLSIAFVLVLFLNPLSIELAFIGAGLAIFYPYMKRFTHLPQVGLGTAFSWGVPMAFAATTNNVPTTAVILFFTALIWPVIYDTQYAMTDRKDDLKLNLQSTAILFGQWDKIIIGLLQIIFLLMLSWVGYLFQLTTYYYLSLILVAILFIYQQRLIYTRLPKNCFRAFLNNHWVGLIIFLGIAASYTL
ncbi:MAG: 4-hydroxybenzoate octaprenyltransferase [Gammaproteobacteria bacterium]|nr:4-hydroxybenzoate octaprenyltransferase [Gammaproteobacteria bacterium]